jgi:hypothetical protein
MFNDKHKFTIVTNNYSTPAFYQSFVNPELTDTKQITKNPETTTGTK